MKIALDSQTIVSNGHLEVADAWNRKSGHLEVVDV